MKNGENHFDNNPIPDSPSPVAPSEQQRYRVIWSDSETPGMWFRCVNDDQAPRGIGIDITVSGHPEAVVQAEAERICAALNEAVSPVAPSICEERFGISGKVYPCQLPAGHDGAHIHDGLTWSTPADLACVRQESAEDLARLRTLASKVDAIRNDIIGRQSLGWSSHVYPLVAALGDAGYPGEGYATARTNAKTLIDERDEALQQLALAAVSRDTLSDEEPSA